MIICFGFVLVSGVVSAADYEHSMGVGPTTQSGDPEDQIQYIITITNEGDLDDTYNLTVVNSTLEYISGDNIYVRHDIAKPDLINKKIQGVCKFTCINNYRLCQRAIAGCA